MTSTDIIYHPPFCSKLRQDFPQDSSVEYCNDCFILSGEKEKIPFWFHPTLPSKLCFFNQETLLKKENDLIVHKNLCSSCFSMKYCSFISSHPPSSHQTYNSLLSSSTSSLETQNDYLPDDHILSIFFSSLVDNLIVKNLDSNLWTLNLSPPSASPSSSYWYGNIKYFYNRSIFTQIWQDILSSFSSISHSSSSSFISTSDYDTEAKLSIVYGFSGIGKSIFINRILCEILDLIRKEKENNNIWNEKILISSDYYGGNYLFIINNNKICKVQKIKDENLLFVSYDYYINDNYLNFNILSFLNHNEKKKKLHLFILSDFEIDSCSKSQELLFKLLKTFKYKANVNHLPSWSYEELLKLKEIPSNWSDEILSFRYQIYGGNPREFLSQHQYYFSPYNDLINVYMKNYFSSSLHSILNNSTLMNHWMSAVYNISHTLSLLNSKSDINISPISFNFHHSLFIHRLNTNEYNEKENDNERDKERKKEECEENEAIEIIEEIKEEIQYKLSSLNHSNNLELTFASEFLRKLIGHIVRDLDCKLTSISSSLGVSQGGFNIIFQSKCYQLLRGFANRDLPSKEVFDGTNAVMNNKSRLGSNYSSTSSLNCYLPESARPVPTTTYLNNIVDGQYEEYFLEDTIEEQNDRELNNIIDSTFDPSPLKTSNTGIVVNRLPLGEVFQRSSSRMSNIDREKDNTFHKSNSAVSMYSKSFNTSIEHDTPRSQPELIIPLNQNNLYSQFPSKSSSNIPRNSSLNNLSHSPLTVFPATYIPSDKSPQPNFDITKAIYDEDQDKQYFDNIYGIESEGQYDGREDQYGESSDDDLLCSPRHSSYSYSSSSNNHHVNALMYASSPHKRVDNNSKDFIYDEPELTSFIPLTQDHLNHYNKQMRLKEMLGEESEEEEFVELEEGGELLSPLNSKPGSSRFGIHSYNITKKSNEKKKFY